MSGIVILIYLAIAILIFLVCREIVCWYWKINQNIALLTEIRDLLSTMANSQRVAAPVTPVAQVSHSNIENTSQTASVTAAPKRVAEEFAVIETQPNLEPSEVQEALASATEGQIRIVQADQVGVSRFFNAIRYGDIVQVRKMVSASPLLVLTKDAYGNSPVDVAIKENNSELQKFFNACLTR